MSQTKDKENPAQSSGTGSPPTEGESARQSNPPDTGEERLSPEQEWQREMDELRLQQGLGPDAVPERRDIRYNDSTAHSVVHDRLVEAGDPRGGELPAHGFAEYERASSKAQMKKAAKESEGNARYFIGAAGWVNNPGEPDHGRAIAIVRINEYASTEDELLDAVQGGRGKVKSYECRSRDGRAELMIVSSEHFKPALDQSEWGKTPINTPL